MKRANRALFRWFVSDSRWLAFPAIWCFSIAWGYLVVGNWWDVPFGLAMSLFIYMVLKPAWDRRGPREVGGVWVGGGRAFKAGKPDIYMIGEFIDSHDMSNTEHLWKMISEPDGSGVHKGVRHKRHRGRK
jgi:hypothetical protein